MGIEESKNVSEVLDGLAVNTQNNYKTTLKQFVEQFIQSREEERNVSIDDLVAEAKEDVTKTQERMDQFYKWLQNEKVEGYPLRGKAMRESSANARVYGYLRGFFVNVGIGFERKWKKKIPKPKRESRATKKDQVYIFYDVDEETKTIRFNREQMQQFLANLKLRDVAITLALLSSSQDTVDLFRLNVGDIREQNGKSRIFWEGNRKKTGVLFRAFISKEATKFIRRYLEQERQGAEDDEPLFVYTRNGTNNRMTGTNLSSIYRDATRRMGWKWEKGEHNPLRPKRMRHLFRTACDTAKIAELFTNAYMGHKNNQGQDYSELSKAALELEYLRVEPFLTVYGEVEESLEIKQDVKKLERRVLDLNRTVDDLQHTLEGRVEEITRRLFEKWMDEYTEELKQAQLDFTKRYEKEVKQK
jgi:site-specific recombinase XerD